MIKQNLAVITIISLLSGCFSDPSEDANKLYVEASQELNSAKKMNYTEALHKYNISEAKIEKILSKYKTTNIAVNLTSGQAKISGFSLPEFKSIKKKLQLLVDVETKPLSCALFIANNSTYGNGRFTESKKIVLSDLALSFAKHGDKEKAIESLKQAINLANSDKYEYEGQKAGSLEWIANSYILVSRELKDTEVLSSALDLSYTIENGKIKSKLLADIATLYVDFSKEQKNPKLLTQALDIANMITSVSFQTKALSNISQQIIQNGEKEKGLVILEKQLEKIKQVKGSNNYKISMYIDILNALTSIDEDKLFNDIIVLTFELINKMGQREAFAKSGFLNEVAVIYAKAKNKDKAINTILQATVTAESINEDGMDSKPRAIAEIAKSYLELAQIFDDKEMIAVAFDNIKLIDSTKIKTGKSLFRNPHYKFATINELVKKSLDIDNKESAKKIIDEAMKLLNQQYMVRVMMLLH